MAKKQKNTNSMELDTGKFLYKEIYEILRKDILAGKHRPGSRIPSADELADTYSVNRLTVRKAVSGLIAEGLVYTRPAQGTYVAEGIEEILSRKNGDSGNGRTLNVGLVSKLLVTDNIGFYHSDMIAGIHKGLIENRANMTILPVTGKETEAKLFEHVRNSTLDAAIYIGPFEQMALKTMVEKGVPAVILDFSMRNSGTDCIFIDNTSGGYKAMEHLASLGHRDFAVVTGDMEQPASNERMNGVMKAAAEKGIPEKSIKVISGNFTEKSGYEAVAGLIKSGKVPTAVFFMNDEMASGGIRAFHELSKLEIPRDVSVVGFDNSAWSLMTNPQLTTVSAPVMQMGKFAVQRLFAKIKNGGDYSPCSTQMETYFIARKSTGKPRR
ncbi:MAG TPA: hypothetical protein DET40_21910 [Lentisphaeria bacterium]|nr:MAG: hypothetical protein A2X45_04005 [Lentisphaerae bacterium GWF2_50_93]HCE46210.1 hypothetical protein [Lentisphaeria bacterium]